jgi:hypothetical protein
MSKASRRATKERIVAKVQQVSQKVLAGTEDLPFAVLLPFKSVMSDHLRDNKIGNDGSLHDITIKFAKDVIKGNHLETAQDNLEYRNAIRASYGLEDHADTKDTTGAASKTTNTAKNDSIKAGAGFAASIATGNIPALVSQVLAYVKVLADKKKAGLPLSPAETKILDNANVAAQKVQDAAQEAVEESLSNRIKDFIFSASGIAFFSALILLVAYLAHRKAKNG